MTITRKTTKMLAMMAWTTAAVAQSSQPQETVNVCLQNWESVHGWLLVPAEAMAKRMFAEIGVGLAWREGIPAGSSAEPPIVLKLVTGEPADRMPGVLAYALPYEGVHISVFCDRIAPMPAPSAVLAHVMVHEITHLLQGISRHSDHGVMKAHWTPADIFEMQYKPLRFTAEDIELIYLGLAARQQSAVALNGGSRKTCEGQGARSNASPGGTAKLIQPSLAGRSVGRTQFRSTLSGHIGVTNFVDGKTQSAGAVHRQLCDPGLQSAQDLVGNPTVPRLFGVFGGS